MGYGRCGHKCYGDHTAIVLFMESKTVRWPQGDREATVRHPHGCCSYHKFALRLPWGCRGPPQGRREAAVRFSSHPRQGKTVSPHGLRKVTVRGPCGVVAALRHCGFWKSLMSSLKKKPARLAMTLGSPYGLHKHRKAAVRFGGLRSLYGRRNHTASYMWPWHNYASYNRVKLHSQGINMFYLVNAMHPMMIHYTAGIDSLNRACVVFGCR